jgi:hypothetical protein
MTEIIRPPSYSENLAMIDHARAAREQLNAIGQTLTATLDADAYGLLADAFAAVGALQSYIYDRAIAQNAAVAAAASAWPSTASATKATATSSCSPTGTRARARTSATTT